MTPVRWRAALTAVVVTGTAARVALALTTDGVAFDLGSYVLVGRWLTDGDPFDVYRQATSTPLTRWPYPPGLFPLLAALGGVDARSPLDAAAIVRLGLSAADAALVLLLHAVVRARGGSRGAALAAAALVSLGPPVITVSGHHGQLDAATWLPAIAALLVWERCPPGRRALPAGLLVGLAVAVKTVPVIVLLALLPTARDRREAAAVVAAGLGLPALLLLPFIAADPGGVVDALSYRGIPGYGGLSLLVQPDLAQLWLTTDPPALTSATQRVQDANGVMTGVALLAVLAVCVRARTAAPRTAVLLVLAVLVAGANVTVAYAVWAVVLLAVAGMLRTALVLQVWLLVPLWMVYTARSRPGMWSVEAVQSVYVPVVLGLLVAGAALLAGLLREELRTGGRQPGSG